MSEPDVSHGHPASQGNPAASANRERPDKCQHSVQTDFME